jgi:arylsulfatase A-like enzyme
MKTLGLHACGLLLRACTLLPALACVMASSHAAEPRRPNVFFIAVDDLNDWIGCLGGHPQAKTPNLDRLAAGGVLFKNAYCAAPSCNPSRTAVFSGLPPHRSGLYQNLQKLREVMPEAELLPRYFSNQGYWSAGSGKLLHYVIDPPSWDDYFPAKAKDDPFPRTFYPKQRPVNLPRGGDWQYVETDWAALDVTDDEFGGDWLVTKWIGEQLGRAHDKPFFLACGIYRPHEPWFVPKKYFEPFPLETIQVGPGYKADDLDDVPPAGQKIARNRYFAHIQEQAQWKQGVQAYLASIHFADAMLGRVLDALEKSPHRDNTIVVLWSDHGWHLGEKEHWQKYTGWRICDRVPLMIRVPQGAPGLREGTRAESICNRPVSLVDLYRTLTELCGLPDKADIAGHSLVPLLREPSAPWPHAALTHLDQPENYALSTERWRYIHYRTGDEELYDIEADPHEWTNLAGNPEHAAKLAEMRALAPKEIAPVHEAQPGINDFKGVALLTFHPASKATRPSSKASTTKVGVLFQNQRQTAVKLIWVDDAGARHEYGVVQGASRRLMQTFAGHVWLILDEQGRELGHFVAGNQPARALIQ